MVSIQYLIYFMKICETNSMNKAAGELYITQPALSQAMKNLENELNVTLMIRSNHGIRLTEDGEKLYRHCELIMRQFSLIDNLSNEDKVSSLSISAFPYVVYPEILRRIKENPAFCKSKIEFTECRVFEIMENVDKMRCELGVIQYNSRQAAMIQKKLSKMNLEFNLIYTRPWAVAVGAHSPLYNCSEVTIEQLKNYRQIRLKDDYFSFMTGEIKIQDMLLDKMDFDIIQSSILTGYLLKETDMFMFCCTHNKTLTEMYDIHLIPISGVEIDISIGWIKKKNHIISSIEKEFIRLLAEETEADPL